MSFIDDNFLLHSKTAEQLYHDHAKEQPIYDYHCHLPPDEIANNRRFSNLTEIWLAGDHYKWRAMRTNGVKEEFCTGDADPYEKFTAWAETVPHTLRNPLYHWTHLELKRYFGIDTLLNADTAKEIWEEANRQLTEDGFSVYGILKKFNVKLVCTTDDPVDDLEHHRSIKDSSLGTKVYPAFRPDKALAVHMPEAFNAWREKLGDASGMPTGSLSELEAALGQRHDYFHENGCRLSDHGMNFAYSAECDAVRAEAIFDKAKSGTPVSASEQEQFASYLMVKFGRMDAAKGWVKQLHIGAQRSNNSRLLARVGPDTGFDSIGDWHQAGSLAAFLDALDKTGELPKTVLYNLNPADNYVFATMIGNFQDGSVPGKMQFGSGWWFLDQKEGMIWQMNALSNLGLLSRFVGMLTDSRSFLSYPRHEYFRRILCNLIAEDVENGEIPAEMDLLGRMVENICFHNAVNYFGMEL